VLGGSDDYNSYNDVWYSSGVGVEENNLGLTIPNSLILGQCQPNPFISHTSIRLGLPKRSEVSLKIYSSAGGLVKTLVSGLKTPGYHNAVWNGCDEQGKKVPNGVYFYRLEAGDFRVTKKMVKME
jgi:hypothetical protein